MCPSETREKGDVGAGRNDRSIDLPDGERAHRVAHTRDPLEGVTAAAIDGGRPVGKAQPRNDAAIRRQRGSIRADHRVPVELIARGEDVLGAHLVAYPHGAEHRGRGRQEGEMILLAEADADEAGVWQAVGRQRAAAHDHLRRGAPRGRGGQHAHQCRAPERASQRGSHEAFHDRPAPRRSSISAANPSHAGPRSIHRSRP